MNCFIHHIICLLLSLIKMVRTLFRSLPMNNRITVCPSILSLLLKTPTNPGIYSSSILGSYGVIRVNDLMVYVVIGPTFSCSITTEIVRNFMHENAIEIEKESEVRQFLAGLPQYTYNQFINLLAYLHFTLMVKLFQYQHISTLQTPPLKNNWLLTCRANIPCQRRTLSTWYLRF